MEWIEDVRDVRLLILTPPCMVTSTFVDKFIPTEDEIFGIFARVGVKTRGLCSVINWCNWVGRNKPIYGRAWYNIYIHGCVSVQRCSVMSQLIERTCSRRMKCARKKHGCCLHLLPILANQPYTEYTLQRPYGVNELTMRRNTIVTPGILKNGPHAEAMLAY